MKRNIIKIIKYLLNKLKHKKKTTLIMTLLCKNEVDIIERWLVFHKNMGVDGIIVTDNGSSDGTKEILNKYKKLGFILEIIEEPSTTYYQTIWCNNMIKLAKKKYKASWVISADADEFWYSSDCDLKQELEKNSCANLIYVYMKDFVPIDNTSNYFSSPYFVGNRVNKDEKEKLNIKSNFYSLESATYKVAFKTKNFKSIYMGNHDARMRFKKSCFASNISIYHYFIRNFDHFVNKTIKGQSITKLSNDYSTAGSHWREWIKKYYLTNNMKLGWDEIFDFNKIEILKKEGIISIDYTIKNFFESYVKDSK